MGNSVIMDRVKTLRKLVEHQQSLRTLSESMESYSAVAKGSGDLALAFSIEMLREAIDAYSKEIRRFVIKAAGNE